MDKKQNAIFNLNNILISAFGDEKLAKNAKRENEKLYKSVDKELQEEFDTVKGGEKYRIKPDGEANLVAGVSALNQGNNAKAFWEFVKLHKKDKKNVEYVKSIAVSLVKLKAYSIVKDNFLETLEKHKNNDPEILNIIGAVYFGIPEHFADAIPYYEKLLKIRPDNADVNYRLAFLYERVYQDQKLDVQIKYAEAALKNAVDKNVVRILLGKLYYRNGQKDKCVEVLKENLKKDPSPDDIIAYSRYLMKEGHIAEGYGLYRCRFETGNVAYPDALTDDKRWDGKKDLKNSTVIVHYEQGFGDTVMFCRYLPDIAKKAKKVIFVVQKNMIPILKSSGYENYCEILSHEADVNLKIDLGQSNRSVMYSGGSGMAKIPHDYHIPLMDTPYLFDESPDKMTHAGGYLTVDKDKVEEYRKKNIKKNKKLKIGLAYHGTKDSILTYRDISVKKFLPLLKMEELEFYSFQSDEYAKELEELDPSIKIYDLGQKFKDFEDTACALSCMDLLISTDNVVMNLAGAMGLKAYGLFNVISESRWYKTEGDDIGWYKSVKPFRAKTFNDWDCLIEEVRKQLVKDFNL